VVYKVTLGQQRERLTKGLVLVNTAVGQANRIFYCADGDHGTGILRILTIV
jgi:hypothetical protein